MPTTVTTVLATGRSGTGMPLWLVCAIAFAAIFLVALAVLLSSGARAESKARASRIDELHRYRLLGAADDDPTGPAKVAAPSEVSTRTLAVLDRMLRARGRRGELLGLLERSGLRMKPEEWAAIQIGAIVVGAAAVVVLLGSLLGILIGAPVGWLACRLFIKWKIKRRAAAFEEQLPDSLQLVAGALRSGFGLNQSIATVVREGSEPVASEFGRALQEVRIGADLDDALEALARRMSSYDLELVVMAIRTAREAGGNLAETLYNTVVTMRERVQLKGQVKVLTAEGRLSAKVLCALPVMLTGYLFAFRRNYLEELTSTGVGVVLLIIGAGLLCAGTFWLSRLTKIEV
jgi:tight adherence protein B